MEASKFGFGAGTPPVFKFDPTDDDIVAHYLLPRALGIPDPPFAHAVIEDDPASLPPPELLAWHGHDTSHHAFFLDSLDMTKNAGRRERNIKGGAGGTWRGQQGRFETLVLLRPGSGELDITYKRYDLTYKMFDDNGEGEDVKGKKRKRTEGGVPSGWVMHEYQIFSPPLQNTVLSRIKLSKGKIKDDQRQAKEEAAPTLAVVDQVLPPPEKPGSSCYYDFLYQVQAGPSHHHDFPYQDQAGPSHHHDFPYQDQAGPSHHHDFSYQDQAGPSHHHDFPCQEQAGPSHHHDFPYQDQARPSHQHDFPYQEQAGPSHHQNLPCQEQLAGPSYEDFPMQNQPGPSYQDLPMQHQPGPSYYHHPLDMVCGGGAERLSDGSQADDATFYSGSQADDATFYSDDAGGMMGDGFLNLLCAGEGFPGGNNAYCDGFYFSGGGDVQFDHNASSTQDNDQQKL